MHAYYVPCSTKDLSRDLEIDNLGKSRPRWEKFPYPCLRLPPALSQEHAPSGMLHSHTQVLLLSLRASPICIGRFP